MNKILSLLIVCVMLTISGCQSDKKIDKEVSSVASNSVGSLENNPIKAQISAEQAALNSIANNLQVSYQHLTNIAGEHCDKEQADGACFQVKLSLTATREITISDWQIYFSQLAPVQSFESEDMFIKHLNGDFHNITFAKGHASFKTGETKSIIFNAVGWSVSEFDAIPNYIVSREGAEPRIIKSTKSVIDSETGLERLPFIKTYTNKNSQFKRAPNDQTQWATSVVLFENNSKLGVSDVNIDAAIIPTPQQVEMPVVAGSLNLQQGIKINYNQLDPDSLNTVVERLAMLGVNQSSQGITINLNITPSASNLTSSDKVGSYWLDVTAQGINITGTDISGVYYGLQSLASLITVGNNSIPFVTIIDQPHYQYRGMQVDVSRNFLSKEFVIELMDQMAAYKLNKLHLHLADDEGWRLEIPLLPELTEVSSKRCLDLTEKTCLLPVLGAGVNPNSSVNGYYSVADYQEILRAATARHIQVIPSLDMPGHSRSSIKAMHARYQHYMEQGDIEKAKQYLLHDLADPTEYSSVQFYNDNTMNVCMESTYAFIDTVMDQVKTIHSDAGHPLTRYHIGADETPGAWLKSPSCKEFLASNNHGVKEPQQLGAYFIERIAKILSDKNIEIAGWDDGMKHAQPENMPEVVQVNAWGNLYEDGHKVAHKLANQNWEVVFSSPEALYFDMPYEADPKEHGYYWAARNVNTRKVFELMPDNLPAHAEIWNDKLARPFEVIDDKATILKQGKVLSGIQGQLWSDTTRTQTMAEYKVYPRLLALAERAWHKAEWAVPYQPSGATYSKQTNYFNAKKQQQRDEQWQKFAKTISVKEMPKLDLAGISYRIPTIGAKVIDGKLHTNSIFPGLLIQYRFDGNDWRNYHLPVTITGKVNKIEVRGVTVGGQRKGRTLIVDI